MNKYEKLLQEAADNKINVYDFDLGNEGLNGLYIDGNIALSDKLETTCQKACIMAEELGHHYTTTGDILDQKNIESQKQERLARGWAYKKMIPYESIKQACAAGYIEIWEIADYLDVDEQFLRDSIEYYGEKYGDEIIKERQKAEFEGALRQKGIEFDE